VRDFIQFVFNGLSLGSIYALLALGFVVIFKATEVVNFAHGSILALGAYAIARFSAGSHLNFYLAVLLGVAIAALLALIIERGLVRTMAGRSVIAVSIMTIGVDFIVRTETTRRIGVDVLTLGDPWRDGIVHLGVAGVTVPTARLVAILTALVLLGGFFAWFKFSAFGVAMRASAEDAETASLMGIRLGRVSAVAWVLAGSLAAVAGVFLTAFPSPGLDAATGDVALRAFPAAILGGLDSTAGAVVGGLIIGVAEVLTAGYQSNLTFLGRGFDAVMPYVVMVAVLLVRPSGLFGTREATRV
jgi:branched-chain amino acid transport system permease protein